MPGDVRIPEVGGRNSISRAFIGLDHGLELSVLCVSEVSRIRQRSHLIIV